MRWLETSPERYDAGMRLITFGRVAHLHAGVAEAAVAKPGDRVLEIGCGTGAVTLRLLARGARVTAIDQSPDMIEQAKSRAGTADVAFLEQTAAEIDALPEASFDAIVLSLCLSDMSASERAWVLGGCPRILAPGGRLVAADEVRAPAGWRRVLQRLWRLPQAALGWLLTGALSHPLADLGGELQRAGFALRREQRWLHGSLALFVAEPSA